jgi:hypothetical protein
VEFHALFIVHLRNWIGKNIGDKVGKSRSFIPFAHPGKNIYKLIPLLIQVGNTSIFHLWEKQYGGHTQSVCFQRHETRFPTLDVTSTRNFTEGETQRGKEAAMISQTMLILVNMVTEHSLTIVTPRSKSELPAQNST